MGGSARPRPTFPSRGARHLTDTTALTCVGHRSRSLRLHKLFASERGLSVCSARVHWRCGSNASEALMARRCLVIDHPSRQNSCVVLRVSGIGATTASGARTVQVISGMATNFGLRVRLSTGDHLCSILRRSSSESCLYRHWHDAALQFCLFPHHGDWSTLQAPAEATRDLWPPPLRCRSTRTMHTRTPLASPPVTQALGPSGASSGLLSSNRPASWHGGENGGGRGSESGKCSATGTIPTTSRGPDALYRRSISRGNDTASAAAPAAAGRGFSGADDSPTFSDAQAAPAAAAAAAACAGGTSTPVSIS